MENTSRLSASSESSNNCNLQTSLSSNQSLIPNLQPHPSECRTNESELRIQILPFNSSHLRLPSEDPTPRGRIIAANKKMHKLYPRSKYRSSLWSPELRFAMRAVGRASSPCLTIQDMIEGKDIFRDGLSQLPNELFRKVYVAKRASRDCILSRLSANLREIDALEKMKDVIVEMHKQDSSQLADISKDLELFKAEAAARGNSIDDDIAYRHAIYADEFTALTSTNTQLNLMSGLSDPKQTFDESESVMSDELDDNSVASESVMSDELDDSSVAEDE